MLVLDGSQGEGGGQILRTSLGLSLVTGMPVRIDQIRAKRKNPGLQRQHLAAVNAAVAIGHAEVRGASLGSSRLDFAPTGIFPGDYTFSVGTAGSATLVLQTVLPALLCAPAPSRLVLEGGTHNPFAPPFDFLAKTFLPLVRRMGPAIEAILERPGFYPAGGGRFTITVAPVPTLARLDLPERGTIRCQRARAIVARLPMDIAERELRVIAERLGWPRDRLHAEEIANSTGPGNALLLEIEGEHVTEVIAGFGEKGRAAEEVAKSAAEEATAYLASEAPVGQHLADQLIIPLALAGGGSFRTLPLSSHTRTNIEVVQKFLKVRIDSKPVDRRSCLVRIES